MRQVLISLILIVSCVILSQMAQAQAQVQLLTKTRPGGGMSSVNNNPLFTASSNAGQMPTVTWFDPGDATTVPQILSKAGGGGVVITLRGMDFGASLSGGLATTSNGSLLYRHVAPSGQASLNGSVRSSGGPAHPIAGDGFNFGDSRIGTPALNDVGQFSYRDVTPTGEQVIHTESAGGGVRLTINGTNFGSQAVSMGPPSLNNAGNVAFAATPSGSSITNIYAGPADGSIRLTVTGTGFSSVSSQVALQPDNSVIFSAVDRTTGEAGLYRSALNTTSYTPTSQYHPPTRLQANLSPNNGVFSASSDGATLTRKGYQYYMAKSALTAAGGTLLGSPGSPPAEVLMIAEGDPVGGSTVTNITMAPTSLIDENNAVFFLQLASGESGFYLVTIPEPTTVLVLAGAAAMALRRRSRAK
jgi:hypothetical protein